ncbi:MAG: hypothetical protein LC750_09560 [Actinobacteria bacterium]|nr:hypothetical protein [Actinomycetota bacterium]
MPAKKVLIVANQTAAGDHLVELVRHRMAEGDVEFTLLVPATPPNLGLTWTHTEAEALAVWRMEEALKRLRGAGARIDGIVGDARPLDAIEDAVLKGEYHEIILSTLPAGMSRWLKQDLPGKAQRRFGLRITHAVDESAASAEAFRRGEPPLHATGS